MSRSHPNALPAGSTVHWYTIHDVLGQGGFGITYLALDPNLNQPVAVKEYLPTDLASRTPDGAVTPLSEAHREDFQWGLNRFITEAQTLSKFDHPNIVSVVSVFEMNETAYMVMRYEDGLSLADMLDRGVTLDENWLKKMILPILDGLSAVHAAGFIHRDIKPGNIYIREDHSPVLLDFGSARRTEGAVTRTLTTLVSPGYAPFEQYYSRSNKQGPWTDIYAFGATLYRGTVGSVPVDALARSEALLSDNDDPYVPATRAAADRYSVEFLSAIDRALSFHEHKRPQDLASWAQELEGELFVIGTTVVPDPIDAAAIPTVQPSPESPNSSARAPGKPRFGWLKSAVPIAAVIGLGAWVTAYQPPEIDAASGSASQVFGSEEFASGAGGDEMVDGLLREAWQDIGAARFIGPGEDNAFARLRRVLDIDPDNGQAKNAMATLHAYFIRKAQRAAEQNERASAVAHARQAAAASVTDEERAAARRLILELGETASPRARH